MSCKNVKVHGSGLMSVENVVKKCKGAWKWSDECFHAPLHFCMTFSTLIRPLPCTFTFFHDIFHTHQTTSMHLYIFTPHLPHSSDHFHASLMLHDNFQSHQSTSMHLYISCKNVKVHESGLMSVEDVEQKCKSAWKWSDECGRCRARNLPKVYQTSGLMQCGRCRARNVPQVHQTNGLMYLWTFVVYENFQRYIRQVV